MLKGQDETRCNKHCNVTMGDRIGALTAEAMNSLICKNPLPDRKAKIMQSYVKNNLSIAEKGVGLRIDRCCFHLRSRNRNIRAPRKSSKGLPLDAVEIRARQEEEQAAQASSSSPALPVLAGYTFVWDSHGWVHNSAAAPRINSQSSQAWLEAWAMYACAKKSSEVIWAFSHLCSDLYVSRGTGERKTGRGHCGSGVVKLQGGGWSCYPLQYRQNPLRASILEVKNLKE